MLFVVLVENPGFEEIVTENSIFEKSENKI